MVCLGANCILPSYLVDDLLLVYLNLQFVLQVPAGLFQPQVDPSSNGLWHLQNILVQLVNAGKITNKKIDFLIPNVFLESLFPYVDWFDFEKQGAQYTLQEACYVRFSYIRVSTVG